MRPWWVQGIAALISAVLTYAVVLLLDGPPWAAFGFALLIYMGFPKGT